MTRTPGRPEVGPKVETRLPDDALTALEADATRTHMSRAEWLRRAALQALPHETLRPQAPVNGILANVDGWLSNARNWALDSENPVAERKFRSTAYAEYVRTLRRALLDASNALPVQETQAAYAQAETVDAEETPELGRLWGRACGVEAARDILEAVIDMLPLDGLDVEQRADLD